MDTVSQILLGAACAELVLGPRIGRRAAVLGAALGTLPDLDVLVAHADAVDAFTRHRSWSHSVFVLSAASLPLAWIVRRTLARAVPFGRCWLGVWLALVTHPLLDAFTTYGTQLWWPLPVPPVAIGSVFIIDPAYTLPLGIGVALAWRRRDRSGRLANRVGLLLSTLWIGVTLLSQAHAAGVAREALAALPEEDWDERARLLVAPFPFALLWRVVALDADGSHYREGWYSLLDGERGMRFAAYPTGADALGAFADDRRVRRLRWFTDGLVRARAGDGELRLTDLRIGAEIGYVFSFVVAERFREAIAADTDTDTDTGSGSGSGSAAAGEGWRAIVARDLPPAIEPAAFGRLARRVVDPEVELRATGDGHTPSEPTNGEVPER